MRHYGEVCWHFGKYFFIDSVNHVLDPKTITILSVEPPLGQKKQTIHTETLVLQDSWRKQPGV